MRKVYATSSGSYSDYHITAIFSTKAKAEAYLRQPQPKTWASDNENIQEFVLDAPEKEWITTTVRMAKDGTVIETWQEKTVDKAGFNCFDAMQNKNLVWSVKTTSVEKAVKVVNEKRGQILALNLWENEKQVAEQFGGQHFP